MPEQRPAQVANTPVKNLRITFWGVQGSCPIFPTQDGVEEYSRRLALFTLRRAIDDILSHSVAGQCNVEKLLGGSPTEENIEAYQRRVGLPDLPFYGGETTSVEVETSEGNRLLFDAGSGIRRCAMALADAWAGRPDRTLYLFGTHEHLDHRSGLSFARFCYERKNPYTINVFGPRRFMDALDQHYGIFSHRVSDITYVDDPIDYTMMPARFVPTELRPADEEPPAELASWAVRSLDAPIQIGSTIVEPFEVYHAMTRCLGYRVTHNGKRFVFCTDHERRRGTETAVGSQRRSEEAEARLRERCRDVDLAYFDGQYFLDEYLGKSGIGLSPPIPRVDWGHSCVEDAIERAFACNIRRTLVGHHDPERTWPQRFEMDRRLKQASEHTSTLVQLADGEMVVDL